MANDSYILGYSGVNNSMEFKKEKFPDFSDEELRIAQGMDSAAALIKNGKVIAAAEEERFTGKKHTHDFPVNAIKYCLEEAGIIFDDLRAITHGFDYGDSEKIYKHDAFNKERFEKLYDSENQKKLFKLHFKINDDFLSKVFFPIKHHESHAASAFFPSGYKSALVVVIDGLGEMNSISVYRGANNKLEILKQYSFLSSLGMFYSILTYHLGFSVNSDEYKVMGLAPYGDPTKYLSKLSKCIEFKEKGEIIVPLLLKNRTLIEKESYRGVTDWLNKNVIQKRDKNDEITQKHKDVAAALQFLLNKAIYHVMEYWQLKTGERNLCYAGGVALNCTANGELLKHKLFENIYIQPAAGDDGTAIGSAIYHFYRTNQVVERVTESMPFYGGVSTSKEIQTALEKYSKQIIYEKLSKEQLHNKIAELIAEEKVIALYRGSMEFGPRALGHRSIIADPRSPIMKDLINSMVKKRESFRPFAPSVTEEDADKYFEIIKSDSLPFMLFTVDVKEKFRETFPAITHVNGSARIQTVKHSNNLDYWNLLKAVEKTIGYPMVLNTSFNVKGQPIVRTAQEAVETFLNTGIHALVLENYLILPR